VIKQIPAYLRKILHYGYLEIEFIILLEIEKFDNLIIWFITLCFFNSLTGPMPEIKSNCGVLIVPAQRIISFLTPILPIEPFLYITLMPSTLLFLKSIYNVRTETSKIYIYRNKIIK